MQRKSDSKRDRCKRIVLNVDYFRFSYSERFLLAITDAYSSSARYDLKLRVFRRAQS